MSPRDLGFPSTFDRPQEGPCHFAKTTDSWKMLWHFPLGDVEAIWIRLEPFKSILTPKSTSQPLILGFSDCSLKLEEWFLLMCYSELSRVLTFSQGSRTFPVLGLNAGDFALNSDHFEYSLWSLILITTLSCWARLLFMTHCMPNENLTIQCLDF